MDLLYPLILQMVNRMIVESSFPDVLKHGIVSPVKKSPDLDPNDFNSFRPLCSLPFLSKILEKVLYLQSVEHLDSNGLYANTSQPIAKITRVKRL